MRTNRWKKRALVGGVICSMTMGCGGDYVAAPESEIMTSSFSEFGEVEAVSTVAAQGGERAAEAEEVTTQTNSATVNRRIIYNTQVGLVVEDYRQFESQLPALVQKLGGFVASSDTDRRYNDRQSGSWVVRIPVPVYAEFLSGVDALGFAESRSENAQDVTEEYIDIEARITNKRKLESRIVTMLEERTGKLSDVLDIERELARVREEIERMEGRLRFLQDRTHLATITIQCREQKEYVPAKAPTFASRVGASWSGSIRSLQMTGQNIALALTAAIPWIVIVGLPIWSMWKLTKRRWRQRHVSSQSA
ncbi:MAG: DUF4349 domain-containing protein [Rubripirellula sp.]